MSGSFWGFFVFVLWLTNLIYQKLLILLNFHCQKTSFSVNTNLDTKAKVFHESIWCFMKVPLNCISWNALKEKCHSVSLPLEKGILKICSRFTGEHPYRCVISINLQSEFIGIILRHGCSPVNLLHIFRPPFPESLFWLLFNRGALKILSTINDGRFSKIVNG